MSSKLRPEGNVLLGLIIDESGSMGQQRDATINSFNEFIEEVAEQKGERVAVVTKFSGNGRNNSRDPKAVRMSKGKMVGDIRPLTYASYAPGGNTPLYDAIGKTLEELDRQYHKLNDGCCSKCGNWSVLVMIQTDGEENASHRFGRELISTLISEREERGWKFIYAGADQDSFTAERQATQLGMSLGASYGYSRLGGIGARSETVGFLAAHPASTSADLATYTQHLLDQKGHSLGSN